LYPSNHSIKIFRKLIDENIDVNFKNEFSEFEVSTVKNLNLLVPQIKNYLNKIKQSGKFDVIEITL